MTKSLDGKIEVDCGLTLVKLDKRHVMGDGGTSYFANLTTIVIGGINRMPDGVHVELPEEIRIEIPKDLYGRLLRLRRKGTAYGRITLELYVRSEILPTNSTIKFK